MGEEREVYLIVAEALIIFMVILLRAKEQKKKLNTNVKDIRKLIKKKNRLLNK